MQYQDLSRGFSSQNEALVLEADRCTPALREGQPGEVLQSLLTCYGEVLAQDPRRIGAFLRDLCGSHRKEIFLWVSAAEDRISARLLAAGKDPTNAAIVIRLA